MSLENCREACKNFVRQSLPLFRGTEANLRTIPKFAAITEKHATREKTRFVELAQPNWEIVPCDVWRAAFATEPGMACLQALASTTPFSSVIGQRLLYPASSSSIRLDGRSIAADIARHYLFFAGTERWKPHAYDVTWRRCIEFFDPGNDRLKCVLYAPLWGFGSPKKRISLGDGVEIRRLSPKDVAQIASLNAQLAGYVFEHNNKYWTLNFFVKELSVKKAIGPEYEDQFEEGMRIDDYLKRTAPSREHYDCQQQVAWLNMEVAMLRALLSQFVAVPRFGLVYNGFPHTMHKPNAVIPDLAWVPSEDMLFSEALSRQQVVRYVRNRMGFMGLEHSQGWSKVAASMRRFAIAWENRFPADALVDIIAALEALIVDGHTEVSYKLRVRASNFLAKDLKEREAISNDLKDGYEYRSRIAHGAYVFDDYREYETGAASKAGEGQKRKPSPRS